MYVCRLCGKNIKELNDVIKHEGECLISQEEKKTSEAISELEKDIEILEEQKHDIDMKIGSLKSELINLKNSINNTVKTKDIEINIKPISLEKAIEEMFKEIFPEKKKGRE